MRVLVFGGTGFIGYHTVLKLLSLGHQVRILCLKPASARMLFPPDIELIEGNLDTMNFDDYLSACDSMDAALFLAGADERSTPNDDDFTFFYRKNVVPCKLLCKAASQKKIKQVIAVGSIFTFLNRQHPELKLAESHPYIASRLAQQNEMLKHSSRTLTITVLELPYIFGGGPCGQSLWGPLIAYANTAFPIMVTKGGANMLSVHSVSGAIVGALKAGEKANGIHTIGDENLSWKELMERLCNQLGRTHCPITILTNRIFNDMAILGGFLKNLFGVTSGLDVSKMADIVTLNAFFDPSPSQKLLNYPTGLLDEALETTIAKCEPLSPNNHWKQYWQKLNQLGQELKLKSDNL
jgi:nucleoside-diphosphate-sugar epimerase